MVKLNRHFSTKYIIINMRYKKTINFTLFIVLCLFTFKTIGQNNSDLKFKSANDQLKYIGMPIGGITSGQVYLGGDGQLWYWDIFNIKKINPGSRGDKFYLNPMEQDRHFEQGFALRVYDKTKSLTTQTKYLNIDGFSEVSFQGEYPIGRVWYEDESFPLSVELEAYTPFIPTDHESSDFPAIVLEYTVTNNSNEVVIFEFLGWLQNMANYQTAHKSDGGIHKNEIVIDKKTVQLKLYSKVNEKDTDLPDYGNMALTLIEGENAWATPKIKQRIKYNIPEIEPSIENTSETKLGDVMTGLIGKEITLKPRESNKLTFLLSWYFPNLHREESGFHNLNNRHNLRQYYSKKFTSSYDVANKIISNTDKFLNTTKLWNKTWYDSSLPKWFLNRTFSNVSTLATTSCYRLDDLTDNPDNEGRFYTMEGVYLGRGTCTHVLHYEQALGRVFPRLARQLITQVDYGLSYNENGLISYRGELSHIGQHDGRGYAVDGQAGSILRAYREHTTAKNNEYLKEYWPKIKTSIQYLINHDSEKTGKPDGILEGIQYNTLDKIWYGKNAWLSGMYNASLLVGEALANEMNDIKFAGYCRNIAELGKKNLENQLFNGEYFYHILDYDNLNAPNTNDGCHVDQLLGKYWAKQVGLPDIVSKDKAKKALSSILKYNTYNRYAEHLKTTKIPVSRFYALPDEPVMIMCSFPKGGEDLAPGNIEKDWDKLVVGYFSEVFSAQEYHVAASMIDHGMIDGALKIMKGVDKRYRPERRNPYNEIEYGNHYTRAMSSFAPFISASGFTLHEPKEIIGFAPKITPDDFKSAFISGNAWGTFTQIRSQTKQKNTLTIKYGSITLSSITLQVQSDNLNLESFTLNEEKIDAKLEKDGNRYQINWRSTILEIGDEIAIELN